jgi:hypothetical protein
MKPFIKFLVVLISFFCGSTAFADEAVVVPLYSSNVNTQTIGNLTSLITSEVDFSGRYDMVSQIDKRPSTLNTNCLKSVTCLKKIATANSTNAIIAGTVYRKSGKLEFNIVMYENGSIVRSNNFKMEDKPSSLALEMAPNIQKLITGQSVEKEEAPTVSRLNNYLDEEEDEEDVLGDFSLDEDDELERKAAEARKIAAAEEARKIAAIEEARKREEQQKMEEEARRLAEQNNDSNSEDFDFDFAPSSAEVVERSSSGITDEREMNLELDGDDPDPIQPEFKESSRQKSPQKSNTNSKANVKKNTLDAKASLLGKMGYSNFQSLNFVTYGGEVGIYVGKSIAISVGLEGYATKQLTPILDENQTPTDTFTKEWRVILPISAGVAYHFPGKVAKPYAGGDIQLIPGYVENGAGMAYGFRARGGFNFMIAKNFGLNTNLSAGFWGGEQFEAIRSTKTGNDFKQFGFVPQFSAGTLILF